MTALATYLGDWCAGLRAADLPEAVAGAARRAVLDTLAVGIAGRSTRVGEEACRLAERRSDDRATRARAWLGARLTPDWAAFANATAAHALDFDDTCFAGTMHGSAVIFPAALAAAEARGASGADLLAAFVAGSEVAYALGATVGASLYDRGWWPTGLLCGAGAAAAVAKLAGSDGEGAARAIAFAALDASGCRALLGTDAKPLGVGLAARRGFESHWLAETGASVPLDLFEQPLGPLRASVGEAVDLAAARSLGESWRLLDPGLVVKPYPLCSCAQPAAAALLAVLERENLAAAEVRGVHAVVTPMVAETLRFDRPENENQAMFSLTHALACVLTDREVTVGHVDRAALFRPDLRAAAARVSYAADDTAFDLARAPEAARVSVETEDGRRFEETVLRAPGDPASPLDDTAFGHKARSCLRRGLSLSDAERVEAMIGGLDGVSDLRDLTDLLAGPAAP